MYLARPHPRAAIARVVCPYNESAVKEFVEAAVKAGTLDFGRIGPTCKGCVADELYCFNEATLHIGVRNNPEPVMLCVNPPRACESNGTEDGCARGTYKHRGRLRAGVLAPPRRNEQV